MSKKGKIAVVSSVILIICLLLCCLLWFIISASGSLNTKDSGDLPSGASDQTIAVIDIDGVILESTGVDMWGSEMADMTTKAITQLERARTDDDVKAVLIRVNSPGGEVYATRKIYNKILDVQEEGKPVVVLMESIAASGGYYLSAPADWIVASEMTMTGSIGVIFTTYDTSKLYEKIGIEEVHIANTEGTLKVMTDLTNEDGEGYKVMQSLADDYYNNFANVVADGRSMSYTEVVELADGRIYSGNQALENGLIDELGELKEATTKIIKLADLDNPNFVIYKSDSGLLSNYNISLTNLISPELSAIKNKLDGGNLKAYYIVKY